MTRDVSESDRLDAFITQELQGDHRASPADDTEAMIAEIVRLKAATRPEPAFAAQLEQRLKQEEKHMMHRWYVKQLVAVAAVVMLAVFGVAFRTELRAFAQEVLDLFQPAASDERTIDVEFGGVSENSPPAVTSTGSPGDVSFAVRRPAAVPAGYRLSAEAYDAGAGSVLRYTCASNANWAFSLWQYDTAAYQIDVGESAAIETVTLDDGSEAQYIRGEWRVSAPPVIGEDAAAGVTLTLTQVWDNQSSVQHLYWSTGGVHNYLSISGTDSPASLPAECAIDREAFLAIANSLE